MSLAQNRASRGEHTSSSSRLAHNELGLGIQSLELRSETFENGDTLPTRATIDGDGTPPFMYWDAPRVEAHSFALICEDPDAPRPEPFVHWLVYAIPSHTRSLDSNLVAFREGKNSRGQEGYAPAAPPHGDEPHHYHFQLFALDREVILPPDVDRGELIDAMRGHVVAWGELVGTYERC
jgi:Raf kinase inhibitor-like YbhB/YbcL family protein